MAIAHYQHYNSSSALVQETAKKLISSPKSFLSEFPLLEKLIYLHNSNFFHRMQSQTLIALAERATVKNYSKGETITEAGDTCRELLLLIEGDAKIHYQTGGLARIEQVRPGQTLDELEVLAHSNSENTIVADSETSQTGVQPGYVQNSTRCEVILS